MADVEWKYLYSKIVVPNDNIRMRMLVHTWFKPNVIYYRLTNKMEEYERLLEEWEAQMGRLRWEKCMMETD